MKMRFIIVQVSLSFLILVSAYSNGSLKDDLRQAAENTAFVIKVHEADLTFGTAKSIVDSRVADHVEIEKFQNLIKQWIPANESFVMNATQLDAFKTNFYNFLPKVSKEELVSRLDQYTKGANSEMQSLVKELVATQYDQFNIRATGLIRVAKEAGYIDNNIDMLFDKFVQADKYHKAHDFNNLLIYVNVK
ncbi:uncharacterized protein LOC117781354 [Drosophila innubila]|uniref:uncharacterized protein LOC117781354 n=1 Tax=Drosophila innubila TaxID=198719 RepID=UPI00148C6070|nr:uncharacterized protein LOC117781354 [Drosophila innubila]